MTQPRFRQVFRYHFDRAMAAGSAAQIGLLALGYAVVVALCAIGLHLLGIEPHGEGALGFLEGAWVSFYHALNTGHIAKDHGWAFRAIMLVLTITGLFMTVTLTGIVTSAINRKLLELRKGRSFVVERGHTLILGWSEAIFPVVEELIEANRNQRRSRLVILAERDKVEMEDALRAKLGVSGRTTIICRTGSPMSLSDLAIANPGAAKAIVVLSPPGPDPDTHVIKTLLALMKLPRSGHVVAELREGRNLEIARMVAQGSAEFVVASEVVPRLIVQTCLQSGLSGVYAELLRFEGSEIYFQAEPALVGRRFGEALGAYEDSCPIGLRREDGRLALCPPMDTVIESGDRLIVIAEDDDTIKLSPGPRSQLFEPAIRPAGRETDMPARILILGWNWRGEAILRELAAYVAPGSQATVLSDEPGAREAIEALQVPGLGVRHQKGDPTDRRVLEALALTSFAQIIVLSPRLPAQQADAQTLFTLLHVRAMLASAGKRVNLISEMADDRNRALATVAEVDDLIVSERLISLMLAQVAENRELNAVFADLLSAGGAEITLRPADHFVELGVPVNFHTVVESARRQGVVAIGYRQAAMAHDPARGYGMSINPAKSAPLSFGEADRVVVIAQGAERVVAVAS